MLTRRPDERAASPCGHPVACKRSGPDGEWCAWCSDIEEVRREAGRYEAMAQTERAARERAEKDREATRLAIPLCGDAVHAALHHQIRETIRTYSAALAASEARYATLAAEASALRVDNHVAMRALYALAVAARPAEPAESAGPRTPIGSYDITTHTMWDGKRWAPV